MGWIKDIIVDVAVTVCIAFATIQGAEWATWIVWIYTPLMVLLRIGAYFGPRTVKKGKVTEAVPVWVYHLLYGINVVLLLAAQWWLVAGGWAAIWLLSYLSYQKG